MKKLFKHHVEEEEETKQFDLAKKVLSAEDGTQILESFILAKKIYLSDEKI